MTAAENHQDDPVPVKAAAPTARRKDQLRPAGWASSHR